MKKWRWVMMGAGAWWLMGLNLFVYHLSAFGLFMEAIHRKNRQNAGVYMPASARFLVAIAVIYSFSIVIHLSSADSSRIVAAVYNLSFWIMGAMIVVVMANNFRSEMIPDILDGFYALSFFVAVVSFLILAAWMKGIRDVTLPSPLYGLASHLGDTNLVKDSLLIRPLMWDWFASVSRPRFNVFSPYPTAAGGCIMIILLMILTRAVLLHKLKNAVFIGVFALSSLGFLMTLSRISILAFLVAFFVVFLVEKKNFVIWLLGLVFVLVICYPLLESLTQWIMGLREGSTSIRFQLYRYSLEQLHDADWIFGLGIKPRENIFAIPLGSHSTYISLLFKTGIIGTTAFVSFQAWLMMKWFRLRLIVRRKRELFLFWRSIGLVLVAMSLWMATEDMDAPQCLAFLYFSIIGCFEGFRRECLYGKS
ncbi:MAG TPA: O-antigen ligase family protein [Verrucomicrobiae bacterium]|nr:O-antigen ligase family protein [Verrucomicrobiae bacterium]